ncbi:hypothetical protein [Intrasporangium flavum]|uniref:hypothetical protein n=1 Tax=Intrasporangium flavum TaxID=1428657 RepID=UPI0009F96D1B|nr:hypothetical protein [Intrasporangium flavum]
MALAAGWLAGCSGRAASDPTDASPSASGRGDTVRVLQLNLCNSGIADCYTGGRAVTRAVEVVREHRPGMVSLNEVCRDDVRVLEQAMTAASPAATVASAFAPARDRGSGAPVRCLNGQEFGDAVLVGLAAPGVAARSTSGDYPVQDPGDTEKRVWVCLDLPERFSACTTHTSSTDAAVALAQCRYLLSSVLATPQAATTDGVQPVVLGADLNLAAGGSPGPDACLPGGYRRTDDGGRQDVVVSPGLAITSHTVIDMQGTTDHPGLLADVALHPR